MGELTHSIHSDIAIEEAEQLVVRLRERDEVAFAEVFDLYRDLIYTVCFKLLDDKAEAMDVTQEVFLTLYQKIHQFRGECSLKTWLYRVAVNQAANRNRWWRRRFFLRGRALSLNLGANGNSTPEPRSDFPEPDRNVYSQELQKAIQKSLNKLPFEQRAAVILREVQELSYEEIAEITGVQVGTVKSRIARGRDKLRELLKAYKEGSSR